jgi:uncharacterized protein YqeY
MNAILGVMKTDSLLARKSGEKLKAVLLSTVMSEISVIGKNEGRETTDEDSLKVVNKFLKGINETIKFLTAAPNQEDHVEALNVVNTERNILMSYLPKQMSEDELISVIHDLVNELPDRNPKQMGVVIKQLKGMYDGQYNNSVASQLIKTALA